MDEVGVVPVDQDLSYATPGGQGPRHGLRVWAAAATLFGGLGLVVLGGCFLIGILIQQNKWLAGGPAVVSTKPSADARVLTGVLYTLAFACFVGATIVIYTGVRGLVVIMRPSQH